MIDLEVGRDALRRGSLRLTATQCRTLGLDASPATIGLHVYGRSLICVWAPDGRGGGYLTGRALADLLALELQEGDRIRLQHTGDGLSLAVIDGEPAGGGTAITEGWWSAAVPVPAPQPTEPPAVSVEPQTAEGVVTRGAEGPTGGGEGPAGGEEAAGADAAEGPVGAGEGADDEEEAPDPFTLFLAHLRAIPLLRDEEGGNGPEIDLARRWQAARAARELLGRTTDPSRREELERIVADGRRAWEQLIVHNLRLVAHQCRRVRRHGIPVEDVFAEGVLGLIRAIDKFDPARGYTFSTYASWWILQAIQRAVPEMVAPVRPPVHVWERISLVLGARRDLERSGREPTVAAIAAATQLSPAEVADALALWERLAPVPLDEAIGIANDPWDALDDAGDRWTALRRLREVAAEAVTDRRAWWILLARHGFTQDGRPRTLEEIGGSLGLTRERVRQIEAKAIDQLRQCLDGTVIGTLSREPRRACVQDAEPDFEIEDGTLHGPTASTRIDDPAVRDLLTAVERGLPTVLPDLSAVQRANRLLRSVGSAVSIDVRRGVVRLTARPEPRPLRPLPTPPRPRPRRPTDRREPPPSDAPSTAVDQTAPTSAEVDGQPTPVAPDRTGPPPDRTGEPARDDLIALLSDGPWPSWLAALQDLITIVESGERRLPVQLRQRAIRRPDLTLLRVASALARIAAEQEDPRVVARELSIAVGRLRAQGVDVRQLREFIDVVADAAQGSRRTLLAAVGWSVRDCRDLLDHIAGMLGEPSLAHRLAAGDIDAVVG